MANNHGHGAFGAHLIEDRDLTPHTTAMSFTPSVDVAEDTGLSPLGDQKTYLQGLSGSAASSSGFALNEYEFLVAEMKNMTGTFRDIAPVTFGWFGFGLGKFLTMAQSRKTSFSIPVSNASTITTSISHQCDGTYRLGHSLLNPFGSSAYTGSEIQKLTFSGADIIPVFGLQFVGYPDVFEFHANDSNSALKAGIEGLLDLIAGLESVTVTVTGSLTGTGFKSGVKTLTFSSSSNVPALYVLTDALGPSYFFSNCPDTTFNGTYTPTADVFGGDIGGVVTYKNSDGNYLAENGPVQGWRLYTPTQFVDPLSAFTYGRNSATPDTPINNDWVLADGSTSVGIVVTLAPAGVPTITASTLVQGGTSPAKWNLLTATGSGTAHDGGATTTTGFYCRMQVLLAAGTAFTVVVEHSDSSSSGFSALHTFTGVTDASNPALVVQEYSGASNASVKRYVRYRITTITGTFAAFVGYARES